MNILCDFHHADLWWSNHLIFEVALGHKLYRPRGIDWFRAGYYYQSVPEVAKQFLVDSMFTIKDAVAHSPCRLKVPLSSLTEFRAAMDTVNGCLDYPLIRTVTLEEFADTRIDAIMVTLSNNQDPWAKLRREIKPKAKLIREQGNVGGRIALSPEYGNILTSDLDTFRGATAPNKILYHQRFDTERLFMYQPPQHFDRITCFMPGFRGCAELVEFTERHNFRPMEFVDFGHYSSRGFLTTKEKYVEEMRRTAFVWHVKPGGDGFGHVLHNSFAIGRPVITREKDYTDSLAGPLIEDGKTCVLIGKDPHENVKKIKSMSHPDKIRAMGEAASNKFKEVVNYDEEAEKIRYFLERLV